MTCYRHTRRVSHRKGPEETHGNDDDDSQTPNEVAPLLCGGKALRVSREHLHSLSTMRSANDALKKVTNNIVSTLEGTVS